MSEDTVVSVSSPAFEDQLSEMLQAGARKMIAAAVSEELERFLECHAARCDEHGRRAVVRNGYQPERTLLTGVGEVAVKIPKTRDRSGARMGFRSVLVPPYLKKTRRVEEVLPCLYLAGRSTNDFPAALEALFGERVRGLSANRIVRLKRGWEAEYASFRQRDWSVRRCWVYLWADGIYLSTCGPPSGAVCWW